MSCGRDGARRRLEELDSQRERELEQGRLLPTPRPYPELEAHGGMYRREQGSAASGLTGGSGQEMQGEVNEEQNEIDSLPIVLPFLPVRFNLEISPFPC
ncbi:unnamed protein product [Urochloa humidicola]